MKSWRSIVALWGLLIMAIAAESQADQPWVVLEGKKGPGKGKHIVLIAGDDEYRSEELIPALARILAVRHGFKCTVLFAINKKTGEIDPSTQDNIPGLEALDNADLMVMFLRFRELPDEQMKHIIDYVNSGRPIIALRTSTHAFRYRKNRNSPYAKWDFRAKPPTKGGFGRVVLGETWAGHYGHHNHESTRGLIAKGMENHPIVRGIEDIWGPSDVYNITTLTGDAKPVIMGQVLSGMTPDSKPNPQKELKPVAWIKTYTGASGKTCKIFTTTMGHAHDFKSEGFRRLLVNAVYWLLGMEVPAKANVDFVGTYDPPPIGMGKFRKGVKPADFKLP